MTTDLVEQPTAEVFAQGRIRFTETGAQIPDDVTYEEWESGLESMLRVERASRWCIGDLLNFKAGSYGDMYLAAVGKTDLAISSLAVSKHVSNRFEFYRRRKNLSWSHHSELAKFPAEEQDNWLDVAEAEELSQKALREHLREAEGREVPTVVAGKRETARNAQRLANLVHTFTNTQMLLQETNVAAAVQTIEPQEATKWAEQLRSVRTDLSRLITALEEVT